MGILGNLEQRPAFFELTMRCADDRATRTRVKPGDPERQLLQRSPVSPRRAYLETPPPGRRLGPLHRYQPSIQPVTCIVALATCFSTVLMLN